MPRAVNLARKHGRSSLADQEVTVNRVIRDPAILLWLDAQAYRKEHSNENLARELALTFLDYREALAGFRAYEPFLTTDVRIDKSRVIRSGWRNAVERIARRSPR
jgi:hypothetical protein